MKTIEIDWKRVLLETKYTGEQDYNELPQYFKDIKLVVSEEIGSERILNIFSKFKDNIVEQLKEQGVEVVFKF
jgi:phenylalanyl-tRNA synthetase beta subunit